MDIMRHKGQRIHVGCGGEVVKGVCLKCGEKKKSLVSRFFGEGPIIISTKDQEAASRRAHRKRIREGRDIFK